MCGGVAASGNSQSWEMTGCHIFWACPFLQAGSCGFLDYLFVGFARSRTHTGFGKWRDNFLFSVLGVAISTLSGMAGSPESSEKTGKFSSGRGQDTFLSSATPLSHFLLSTVGESSLSLVSSLVDEVMSPHPRPSAKSVS